MSIAPAWGTGVGCCAAGADLSSTHGRGRVRSHLRNDKSAALVGRAGAASVAGVRCGSGCFRCLEASVVNQAKAAAAANLALLQPPKGMCKRSQYLWRKVLQTYRLRASRAADLLPACVFGLASGRGACCLAAAGADRGVVVAPCCWRCGADGAAGRRCCTADPAAWPWPRSPLCSCCLVLSA